MWNSKKKTKGSLSGIHEAAAEKLFAEIADPDDPTVANMEGVCVCVCVHVCACMYGNV